MIYLKRVYDQPAQDDGLRLLVERLWPRGLTKEQAKIDLWLKDVAPSPGLRQWYSHDIARWMNLFIVTGWSCNRIQKSFACSS